MVEAALAAGADQVLILPSYRPPHKADHIIASDEQRVEMCGRLAKGLEKARVETLEIDEKLRYTADTLRRLHEMYPDNELILLLGADALRSLRWWKSAESIVASAEIWAFHRGGSDDVGLPNVRYVDTAIPAVSSSDVRGRCLRGESIQGLVPKSVEQYILSEHLYESEE